MDVQVLKEFVFLAEEKSFTTASEKLYMSQSVLTKHIQKLEEELKFKLFIREIPLKLTPSGEYVYDNIKPLLSSLENALDHEQIEEYGYLGTLKLGIPFFSRYSHYKTIRNFERTNPKVKTSVICSSSNELLNKLISDELDIAVLFTLDVPDTRILEQFTKFPIFTQKLQVLVNEKDDRFRNKNSVSINDIKDRTFLLVDNNYFRAFFKNCGTLTKKYGVTFTNVKYVPTVQDALLHIALYDSVAILPGDNKRDYGKGIKMLPIEEPEFTFTSYYVWKMTNKNTSIIKFIQRISVEE